MRVRVRVRVRVRMRVRAHLKAHTQLVKNGTYGKIGWFLQFVIII